MNRWYDKDVLLADYIEKLRDAEEPERDLWVKDLLSIMQESEPDSLKTENLIEFPIKIFRRRWYDSDPYLWLLMNGMQSLEPPSLSKIKEYLAKC